MRVRIGIGAVVVLLLLTIALFLGGRGEAIPLPSAPTTSAETWRIQTVVNTGASGRCERWGYF